MKIKRINTTFLLLALAGLTLTGCSNEDLANITPQEEGTGNVSFSIIEKDYEPADNTPKSRAAEETKPEIQDLGDGLMAEVSLVPDTTHRAEAPKTRAINTPTHYTIQAYQGGVKKGELKGTFNGSTFTPDPGQPKAIALPHGTYDFVCFNDGVTSNGTQLTVNLADAATARFDVQRNVVINQDPKQQIKFTMKHAGAALGLEVEYMNFDLHCRATNVPGVVFGMPTYKGEYIDPAEQYKVKVETPASAIPETMVYDLATNTSSYPVMGQISWSDKVDPFFATPGTSPGQPYDMNFGIIGTDYCLPSTDCSEFKITFIDGTIYGVDLAGKTITVQENKLVEANKRYVIRIRLYITNQYLYDDGTAGPRNKNLGKTPIAVVLNPYTRWAVALKDAKNAGNDMMQWSSATSSSETAMATTNYPELFYFGESVVHPGVASNAAAGYTPTVTGHPWCVGSVVDFCNMGNSLGRMLEDGAAYKTYFNSGDKYQFLSPSGAAATGFTPAPSSVNFPAMIMTRFNDAFTKVGGTPPSGTYWTRTECKDGTEYKMATIEISGGKFHLDIKPKTSTAKVRPFIKY